MCDQSEAQFFNSDQSEAQFFNCDPCQYDFSSGAQFDNFQQSENCQLSESRDNQFCSPSSKNDFDWCETSSNNCPMPCYTPNQNQQSCDPCAPQCPPFEACYTPNQNLQSFEPCVTSCDPCEPCVPRCNPCEPIGPCPMPLDNSCPRYPCPPLCSPMCSPYRRRRYMQPARRESFKPVIRYQRPCIPMTEDTVYKKSFDFIDAQTAAACRMPPVRPSGQLRAPCGNIERETVTKLSFQRNCRPERAQPIYPHPHQLLGSGPMQGLTTQKHDFVPKFQFQRVKCSPRDNIGRAYGCSERSTVQGLSYMKPDFCNFSKAVSFKPMVSYKRPEMPMEFETTQKLSFMPVCPPLKEDLPWARKAKYCPPQVQFAKDTIAKMSYQPPGCFVDENCCCEVKCDDAPRAGC